MMEQKVLAAAFAAIALLSSIVDCCAARKSCHLRRCTISNDDYRQAFGQCQGYSSEDDNAVRQACVQDGINKAANTCRILKYECGDLGAVLFGDVPGAPADDYVVSVERVD